MQHRPPLHEGRQKLRPHNSRVLHGARRRTHGIKQNARTDIQ
jgi:hypothetical protein